MSLSSLLPANATRLEQNLAKTLGRFNPPARLAGIWNANTCPESFLPHLAYSVSVDEWDNIWTANRKRAVILAAPDIHRKKGTPYAIRTALTSVGQPDAHLIERSSFIRCDGSVTCNGEHTCGGDWATFRVVLYQPITIADAYRMKSLIDGSRRNSVHLVSIDFPAAGFKCDGSITSDGTVTCGAVATSI